MAVRWSARRAGPGGIDPAVQRFTEGIIRKAEEVRLQDLWMPSEGATLYRERRHGVDVVAVRTAALDQHQLIGLLRYRMAQYLMAGFFDPGMVFRQGLTHEPLSDVSADDVHVVATSTATGEVLCYAVLLCARDAEPGMTLRSADRPLLPLERAHGRDILNRLSLLPDLPLRGLRELGRFIKNQQRGSFNALSIRSPIEVGLALLRTVTGPLRSEVHAVVGSLEEEIGKRNLDFFHTPLALIRGTVPCTEDNSILAPRYRDCATYPFAVLVADMDGCRERLDAIEQALSRPGHAGLMSLLALKDHGSRPRSSLEPAGGLPPLSSSEVGQAQLSTAARRQLRDLGSLLRAARPFRGLSDGEAAVLASFIEFVEPGPTDLLIREGDIGDDLFVIIAGEAEVRVRTHVGRTTPVALLGPGDHFGEISLVTGGSRSADVVALTPMRALRITKALYGRYLWHMAEVDLELTRAVAARLAAAGAARGRG